tara:strand:+ start:484 stop:990 length:507 start_codon:yes stop_codon:yes gene_type:complete
MELIASYTATGSVASIDFTSIAADWTDLILKVSARNDAITTVGGLWIQFNGATTNLSSRILYGTGSAAGSFSDTTIFAYSDAASATSSTFSNVDYYIPNYAGSTNKSVSVDAVMENNATAASSSLTAGLWSNTAAITSIKLQTFNNSNSALANFVIHSTAYLYGVSNA